VYCTSQTLSIVYTASVKHLYKNVYAIYHCSKKRYMTYDIAVKR